MTRTHEEALELFNANTELAVIVAKTHHELVTVFPCADLDDAIQVCLSALWRCARRYDSTKGASFRTYASHRLYGSLRDAHQTLRRLYPFTAISLDGVPEDSSLYTSELPDPMDLEADTVAALVVEEFIQKLSERDRLLLNLYNQGYSQKDLAGVFGISLPAVCQAIRRAAERYARVAYPGQRVGLK